MADYIDRYIETTVAEDVRRKMVFIGGPRQSGKTTLAKALAKSMGARFTRVQFTPTCYRRTSWAYRFSTSVTRRSISTRVRYSRMFCSRTRSTAPRPARSQRFWRPWRKVKSRSRDVLMSSPISFSSSPPRTPSSSGVPIPCRRHR